MYLLDNQIIDFTTPITEADVVRLVGWSFHWKAHFSSSLPNEDSITRLIGAVLFEQNDEWQTQHRYMQVEAFAAIDAAEADPILSIETQAA